jgi:hypothetical protein
MNIYDKFIIPMVWDAQDKSAADGGGDPSKTAADSKSTNLDSKDPAGEKGGDVKAWNGLVKDPDNLSYVTTKGWQSPDDAVKSYRDLEVEATKNKIAFPGKDSKPEEIDAFYEKLGVPKEVKGYEFKMPEKLPENFPYESEAAENFKGMAHKLKLTPDQAQGLHDWYVGQQATSFEGDVLSTVKKVESAHDLIVKNFGDPKSDSYKRKIELADRSVRELGRTLDEKNPKALREELVSLGAITPDGKVMAPYLIMALSRVGDSIYSEDKVFSGMNANNNPFADKTENLTAQGQVLKQDPETARQLILAANKKPQDYGLK